MINIHCPLKTCQAKNDKESAKCWNCGGPMPENAWNSPAAKIKFDGDPEIQRRIAAASDIVGICEGVNPDGTTRIRFGCLHNWSEETRQTLMDDLRRLRRELERDESPPQSLPSPDGRTPDPTSSSKHDP